MTAAVTLTKEREMPANATSEPTKKPDGAEGKKTVR